MSLPEKPLLEYILTGTLAAKFLNLILIARIEMKFFVPIVLTVLFGGSATIAFEIPLAVRMVLHDKCVRCHGPQEQNAAVRLDNLSTDLVRQPVGAETWHDALNAIKRGEMPPDDEPRLSADERRVLSDWIRSELDRLQQHRKAHGGAPELRRLNRLEYQNTMCSLLGIDIDYVQNLPPDPVSEDGFRNNASALKMSALQLEYYLKAARQGLQRAIVEGPAPPVFEHTADESVSDKGKGNWTNRLGRSGQFVARIPEFPDEGEFVLRIRARSEVPAGSAWPVMQVRLGFRADVRAPSRVVAKADVSSVESQEFVFRGRLEEFPIQSRDQSKYPGMLIWIENVYDDGKPAPKPRQVTEEIDGRKKKKTVWDEDPYFPGIVVESLTFKAPVFAAWPPAHHRGLIPRTPVDTTMEQSAAREALEWFLPLAFRRPLADDELATFLRYYDTVRTSADSFEAAMREVYAMVLVSPDFLYLSAPPDAKAVPYAVAARLSYFLWSDSPDEILRALAASGELLDPNVLRNEVTRMLNDVRVTAFTHSFADQWLDLAGVDRVAVNPEFYPDFDNDLKPLFRRETQEFFAEIVRTDLSALQLLDADFTMLNETLARHYGIDGPKGGSFERVTLPPAHRSRGGLLGHASVLLANSTGEDSHPIKRAVWLRSRLLNDPPAPPPPDVPDLNTDLPEIAALPARQQLLLHLENDACADCHRGIDPWGVALDAFDAVGLHRTVIRKPGGRSKNGFAEYPVETSVDLPDGSHVDGLSGLKSYLLQHRRDELARTVVERLLAYALGRSLRFDDTEVVDDLTTRFVASDYRIRQLIADIVCCPLFLRSQ